MNEPQLSAEMEKQIEKVLVDMEKHYCRLNGQDDGYLVKKATMRKILATALEEQRKKYLLAVEMLPETFEVENDGELLEVRKGVFDFKEEVLSILNGKE